MPRAGFVELALAVVAYGKAAASRDFRIEIWKIDSEAVVFHKPAKAQPALFDVTEHFCTNHPRSAKVLRTLYESSAGVWKMSKIADAQPQVKAKFHLDSACQLLYLLRFRRHLMHHERAITPELRQDLNNVLVLAELKRGGESGVARLRH